MTIMITHATYVNIYTERLHALFPLVNNKRLTIKMMTRLFSLFQKHPLLISIISGCTSLAYAIFYGILAADEPSYWLITLCFYYVIIGIMRLIICQSSLQGKKKQATVMKIYGMVIILLSFVFSGITFLTINEMRDFSQNKIIIIAIAAYTFVTVVLAIINIIRAHRSGSAMLILQRNIALVAAIGSLLSLQRGMISTFGTPGSDFFVMMNAISGGLAFLTIFFIGIRTIRKSGK